MKKLLILATAVIVALAGCIGSPNQEKKDQQAAAAQQSQYAASQPLPMYDWSLERHLIIELYNLRNMKAITHSVWRSSLGSIEGDCPSVGFGIPYDTSLTNPLTAVNFAHTGYDRHVVEQAEPNGIFASKNTVATWVLCAGATGTIEPVYVETMVTAYPYPVKVDYTNDRVTKAGAATVTISAE